jgi:hypothetical protein
MTFSGFAQLWADDTAPGFVEVATALFHLSTEFTQCTNCKHRLQVANVYPSTVFGVALFV